MAPNSAEAVAKELINNLAHLPNPFGQAAIELTVHALTRYAAAEQVQARQERDEAHRLMQDAFDERDILKQAALAQAQQAISPFQEEISRLKCRMTEAEQARGALQAALRTYGRHTGSGSRLSGCQFGKAANRQKPCTCGLIAVMLESGAREGTNEETRSPA